MRYMNYQFISFHKYSLMSIESLVLSQECSLLAESLVHRPRTRAVTAFVLPHCTNKENELNPAREKSEAFVLKFFCQFRRRKFRTKFGPRNLPRKP